MLIKSSINGKEPTRPIKSVRDARTGEEDYETKWEYVDELCDRAIEAMNGDRNAMFFNSHLNDNGFVIKGKYIDQIEDRMFNLWGTTPDELWTNVCKSLAMDKLARITKAVERKNGQLEVEWAGNGLMNNKKPVKSSRRTLKSSAQSDYDKGADYAEEQYQKYVEGGIDAEDIAAPADCSNDFSDGFNDKILEYKISSSRKPVKSSVAPDGLSFDNRIDNDDSSIVQYKVTDENVLNDVKGYLSYGEDELKLGNVFINLMYDDSDTLVAAQVVDTESSTWDLSPEECIEIFGSDIMTNVNPRVGRHAVDEFMDFDVDPLKSSRRAIKSAYVIYYNDFSSAWGRVSAGKSPDDFIDVNGVGLVINPNVGAMQFNTPEEAKEWLENNSDEWNPEFGDILEVDENGELYDLDGNCLTSSRRPVKSSFIVGKQNNGNKVYFCEDGQYYSENDYTRPSIKIFNSKREADRIAKRSKSGFVSPLEK